MMLEDGGFFGLEVVEVLGVMFEIENEYDDYELYYKDEDDRMFE